MRDARDKITVFPPREPGSGVRQGIRARRPGASAFGSVTRGMRLRKPIVEVGHAPGRADVFARSGSMAAPGVPAGLLASGSFYSPRLPARGQWRLAGFVPGHSGGTAPVSHRIPSQAPHIQGAGTPVS
ncbi:hypothetical protein JCM15519_14850 [Fundidesulfovibrio butyratiphilus]